MHAIKAKLLIPALTLVFRLMRSRPQRACRPGVEQRVTRGRGEFALLVADSAPCTPEWRWT